MLGHGAASVPIVTLANRCRLTNRTVKRSFAKRISFARKYAADP
jgi:hypothetical protein